MHIYFATFKSCLIVCIDFKCVEIIKIRQIFTCLFFFNYVFVRFFFS